MTEINTKINSVLNQLPAGTQQPVITVQIGQTIDAMYIGFKSNVLAPNQITDYIVRAVQPRLQAVQGVQTAELLGQVVFGFLGLALLLALDPKDPRVAWAALGIAIITVAFLGFLAAQLGGELTAGSAEPGARFSLEFPLEQGA